MSTCGIVQACSRPAGHRGHCGGFRKLPDRSSELTPRELLVVRLMARGLPWKAMLRGEFEGRTVGSFGLGFKPLPEEVRRQYTTTLDTTGFTPPAAYDARDRYAADPACVAYSVLDQGGCGSRHGMYVPSSAQRHGSARAVKRGRGHTNA